MCINTLVSSWNWSGVCVLCSVGSITMSTFGGHKASGLEEQEVRHRYYNTNSENLPQDIAL